MHRSLSTLDVLVVGLLAISMFDLETALGIPAHLSCSPTPPTVSTSSSARACSSICWHCRWPIFRRGASETRWRGCAGLENIRNFLTSSALTLAIDLLFTCRLPRGDVRLFAVADLDRARLVAAVLHRDLGGNDAAVSPKARRKIPAWRRKSGLSGRKRDGHRDAQGHGGRTADATALGRATRRLCFSEFRVLSLGNTASQLVQFISKAVTAGILSFRRPARDRRRLVGR